MFCPKCGSILTPQNDGKKTLLGCRCGFMADKKVKIELKEERADIKEIEAVEEIEVYPLTEAECPKCGHDKAYYWEVQTRASDEPATKFMKCEKCKHIWRDYK
ncbi:MAG: transcription factor S [archaeon]